MAPPISRGSVGLVIALGLGLTACSSLTTPHEYKVDKDSVIAAKAPPPPPAPPPTPAARPAAAAARGAAAGPKKKGG